MWLHNALPGYYIFHKHNNYWFTVFTNAHQYYYLCSYMYIINLHCTSWSIINHSDFNLFPEYFREFSQYIQRKELKWIKIPVTKEVLRGKCSFINFERLLFFMKYFIGWPLKSQMQYSERRVVQCTCMTQESSVLSEKTLLEQWNNCSVGTML